MEWAKVWESLVASGPLAGVLAFAVWKLWARVVELTNRIDQAQEDRIKDIKDLLTLASSRSED